LICSLCSDPPPFFTPDPPLTLGSGIFFFKCSLLFTVVPQFSLYCNVFSVVSRPPLACCNIRWFFISFLSPRDFLTFEVPTDYEPPFRFPHWRFPTFDCRVFNLRPKYVAFLIRDLSSHVPSFLFCPPPGLSVASGSSDFSTFQFFLFFTSSPDFRLTASPFCGARFFSLTSPFVPDGLNLSVPPALFGLCILLSPRDVASFHGACRTHHKPPSYPLPVHPKSIIFLGSMLSGNGLSLNPFPG